MEQENSQYVISWFISVIRNTKYKGSKYGAGLDPTIERLVQLVLLLTGAPWLARNLSAIVVLELK